MVEYKRKGKKNPPLLLLAPFNFIGAYVITCGFFLVLHSSLILII